MFDRLCIKKTAGMKCLSRYVCSYYTYVRGANPS